MYGYLGAVVWDPMAGSGTTLVEASVAGMPSVGTDINPIATLVARAKTQLLNDLALQQIASVREQCLSLATLLKHDHGAASRLIADSELPAIPNRDHWFHKHSSRELVMLKRTIECFATSQAAHDLCFAAMSAVIVAVSYQDSETRWRATARPWLPGDALEKFGGRLTSAVAAVHKYAEKARAPAEVHTADARHATVEDSSVDLVITSPPYANSHDYYLYNKLRMFWLGYDVHSVQASEIGSRNRHSDKKESISTYFSSLAGVLTRIRHALRPTGRAVLVVGDAVIRGELIDMRAEIPSIARPLGLDLEFATAFAHRRFNSTFTPGFGTTHHKQTHVLVFAPR